MPSFVIPQSSRTASVKELVVEILATKGVDRHAEALADLFLAACEAIPVPEPSTGDLDDDAAYPVEYLGDELRGHVDAPADEVCLRAALALVRGARQLSMWKPEVGALCTRLARHLTVAYHGADFTDALVVLLQGGKEDAGDLKYTGLLRALLHEGLVDPARIIDPVSIRTTKKALPNAGQWDQGKRERDPSLVDYWAAIDPKSAAVACEALARREPIETLGEFAYGLQRSLDIGYPKAEPLYLYLGPLALRLLERRRSEKAEADRLLTRCCWVFARSVFDPTRAVLPDEYAAPLTELALAELGRMRAHVRVVREEAAERESEAYLHAAIFFLLRLDRAPLWDVLRRLLLAFRELPKRAVPLDLRTWFEHDAERPGWLPEHITNVLELFLGRELARDTELEQLRTEMAKFFLERLKTRERKAPDAQVTANDMVELQPAWRVGYIHALRELHVNPGNRGHHVLDWAREHDPDENVRAAAQATYGAVRRARGIPTDTSPRRAIYAAYWCLRQAHVRALGGELDMDGAQRTFRKEVRRAKDLDSRS